MTDENQAPHSQDVRTLSEKLFETKWARAQIARVSIANIAITGGDDDDEDDDNEYSDDEGEDDDNDNEYSDDESDQYSGNDGDPIRGMTTTMLMTTVM